MCGRRRPTYGLIKLGGRNPALGVPVNLEYGSGSESKAGLMSKQSKVYEAAVYGIFPRSKRPLFEQFEFQ